MNKKLFAMLLPLSVLALVGCKNNSSKEESSSSSSTEKTDTLPEVNIDQFNRTYEKFSSDSVYVRKVENLNANNFIMGIDASSVISCENAGVKFYDFQGKEEDVFKVLSDSGVNYIRVRVWNDPKDAEGHYYGGGNCDINTALAIGKRATKYNMSLLVDFHYSDFWADPSKQTAPKAWEDLSISEKVTALHDYTYESLTLLKNNNVKVGMVQVGNETNGGNLAGSVGFNAFNKLAGAGSKAVREVFPDALVAVHFANPEKTANYLDWAKRISNLDYDVFGTSYYPYWHGTMESLTNVLNEIATTYNKYTMVMETSYAWTEEDFDFGGNTIGNASGYTTGYPFTLHGQINCMVDLINTMKNKVVNGIGICYWEGTWISAGGSSWQENEKLWRDYGCGWAAPYAHDYDNAASATNAGGTMVDNQAFFTTDGKPLETLKLFNLVRFGNEIELFADGVENIELYHYDNDDFTLPETVNVIYCDNSRSPVPVVWSNKDTSGNEVSVEIMKAAGNSNWTIPGTANGLTVYCTLHMMEFNYVTNYSFESGMSGWTRTINAGTVSDTHKVQITNENPQSGSYAFHFWTSDKEGVNFDITQKIEGLESGNYKLQASVLGGGNGTNAITASKENCYLYVKINSAITGQQTIVITRWDDGYQTYLLRDISYNAGDELIIGVHIEIHEGDCWGDIDDVMFNKVS